MFTFLQMLYVHIVMRLTFGNVVFLYFYFFIMIRNFSNHPSTNPPLVCVYDRKSRSRGHSRFRDSNRTVAFVAKLATWVLIEKSRLPRSVHHDVMLILIYYYVRVTQLASVVKTTIRCAVSHWNYARWSCTTDH